LVSALPSTRVLALEEFPSKILRIGYTDGSSRGVGALVLGLLSTYVLAPEGFGSKVFSIG
jgi:hypothetical protein